MNKEEIEKIQEIVGSKQVIVIVVNGNMAKLSANGIHLETIKQILFEQSIEIAQKIGVDIKCKRCNEKFEFLISTIKK